MGIQNPVPPTITCPNCKHKNPYWYTTCEQCNAPLPVQYRRGCIAAYVIVMGFFGLFAMAVTFLALTEKGHSAAVYILSLVVGGLIVIGGGWWLRDLWRGKNWARVAAIWIHFLLAIGFIIMIITSVDAKPPARLYVDMTKDGRAIFEAIYSFVLTCTGIFMMFPNAFAIYWFRMMGFRSRTPQPSTPPPSDLIQNGPNLYH